MVRQAEFFATPETEGVSRSDLAAARDVETRQGAAYGNPLTPARRLRRLLLRLKSHLRGRHRLTVSYR